jgi:uncharacterized protein
MVSVRRPNDLIGVLLILIFAICSCVKTDAPAVRYYLLTPTIDAKDTHKIPNAGEPLQIEIASLRLPQYLERPQIVSRSSENRLEFAEFHQWGGNLRKNMIRVLAQNLSNLLATPNMVISPHRPLKSPDYRIEIEVMHFEKNSQGRIWFSTRWRLSRGAREEALAANMTDLISDANLKTKDFDHAVSTMSGLMGELSRIIGKAILNQAAGRSAQ